MSGCLLQSVRVWANGEERGTEKEAEQSGSAGDRARPGTAGCQRATGASAETLW